MRPKYVSGVGWLVVVCRKIGLLYTTCSVPRPSVRFSSVPNHFSPPILFLEGPFQDCPRGEDGRGGGRGWVAGEVEGGGPPPGCSCTSNRLVVCALLGARWNCVWTRTWLHLRCRGQADPMCTKNQMLAKELRTIARTSPFISNKSVDLDLTRWHHCCFERDLTPRCVCVRARLCVYVWNREILFRSNKASRADLCKWNGLKRAPLHDRMI